jgi:TatD family-associated radical SAM protein
VARAVAGALKVSFEEVVETTTQNLYTALGVSPDRRPSGIYRLEDTIYIQTTTAGSGLDTLTAFEDDIEEIEEAIICGYADPLDDLDRVMASARWAAEKGLHVRVNTSGLGNVTAGRDITRELSEFVDEVVVVFHGTTAGQHERAARAGVNDETFDAMKEFVRRSAEAGMDAVCEFVAAPKFKADPCREFAKSLGAQYDIRMYRS